MVHKKKKNNQPCKKSFLNRKLILKKSLQVFFVCGKQALFVLRTKKSSAFLIIIIMKAIKYPQVSYIKEGCYFIKNMVFSLLLY